MLAHPNRTTQTLVAALLAGSYVANRVSDKIVKLTDNIYACRSGSAADTQAVCDYAKRFLSDYA